jgi:hypothetical protein
VELRFVGKQEIVASVVAQPGGRSRKGKILQRTLQATKKKSEAIPEDEPCHQLRIDPPSSMEKMWHVKSLGG